MSIYDYSRGAQGRNQQRYRATGPPLPPPLNPSQFEQARQARLNKPAGQKRGGPSGPGLLGRAFRSAMSRLGPAGQIVNAALDVTQGYDVGQSIEELVKELHEAKRTNPRAAATYDSLLAAAQEVLDEAEKQAPPLRDWQPGPTARGGGMSPPAPPGTPGGPPPGAPPPGPGVPPAPSPGAGSQLIPTQLEPTMTPPGAPPRPGEQVEWSEEIQVESSNVWSFRYHYPSSTLAITYKAPRLNPAVQNRRGSIKGIPGQSIKGKLNQPGPIYYYSGVPVRIFRLLTSASSAGGAVWRHIRVKGSKWAHQFPYRLAQASIQPGEGGRLGVWVPRRQTARGYRYRTQAYAGRGRRGYIESSLPQRLTAAPDRGEPDRGTPDRGTFF